MNTPLTQANVHETAARLVNEASIVDMHTHLFPASFGDLMLCGIDELLTYHYLIAEVLRAIRMAPDTFYALGKTAQADLIWRELFVERLPVSEACRGVVTVLHTLGLDPNASNLTDYRAWFSEQTPEAHIENVFSRAGVEYAVMTNDPFDVSEREAWNTAQAHPRFKAALRLDGLLNDWDGASEFLQGLGYAVTPHLDTEAVANVRRFLQDEIKRMGAIYMAVSLSPDFQYPEDSARGRLLDECVLPVAAEYGIPLALMIGVKRGVNPALRLAGDGVGPSDVGSVERLCSAYPGVKFMVTLLARENQHALCVAARKFSNLLIFGCWWFLNNPSLIEEMTRMRLELLGLSVMPQHSDARILEQLLYKWTHSRRIIGKVVGDKAADLIAAGRTVTEAELARDVQRLTRGVFEDFLS